MDQVEDAFQGFAAELRIAGLNALGEKVEQISSAYRDLRILWDQAGLLDADGHEPEAKQLRETHQRFLSLFQALGQVVTDIRSTRAGLNFAYTNVRQLRGQGREEEAKTAEAQVVGPMSERLDQLFRILEEGLQQVTLESRQALPTLDSITKRLSQRPQEGEGQHFQRADSKPSKTAVTVSPDTAIEEAGRELDVLIGLRG